MIYIGVKSPEGTSSGSSSLVAGCLPSTTRILPPATQPARLRERDGYDEPEDYMTEQRSSEAASKRKGMCATQLLFTHLP